MQKFAQLFGKLYYIIFEDHKNLLNASIQLEFCYLSSWLWNKLRFRKTQLEYIKFTKYIYIIYIYVHYKNVKKKVNYITKNNQVN